MRFYLGTTDPGWLQDPRFEAVPLFVSRNRLVGYDAPLRARTRWALDSGAFTMISTHGKWLITPKQYAVEARRWQIEIGRMDSAAICDWMCEPEILQKTGKSIHEHQMLTTQSLHELRDLEPGVPWMPVLQGWQIEDYLRHIDQYAHSGVDLTKEPVVGVGSVCRRQNTKEAEKLMTILHRIGIKPHGFGMKSDGLARVAKYMESADSLAWSYAARFGPVRLPECTHSYQTCEYCPTFALKWRRDVMEKVGRSI